MFEMNAAIFLWGDLGYGANSRAASAPEGT